MRDCHWSACIYYWQNRATVYRRIIHSDWWYVCRYYNKKLTLVSYFQRVTPITGILFPCMIFNECKRFDNYWKYKKWFWYLVNIIWHKLKWSSGEWEDHVAPIFSGKRTISWKSEIDFFVFVLLICLSGLEYRTWALMEKSTKQTKSMYVCSSS